MFHGIEDHFNIIMYINLKNNLLSVLFGDKEKINE